MAEGDIGAVIDSLEFDTIYGGTPDIIHVSGSVFAIAYEGAGNNGFVTTVTINADGSIDNAVIDTLEFDTVDGKDPTILHVSGSVFAIAYEGAFGDGFVTTVTINANGLIDDAVIDTLEFDLSSGANPDIIHVSGNVFAVTSPGDLNRGFVSTVTINANGLIDDAVIDTLQITTLSAFNSTLVHVSGSVFAIAYEGWMSDGFVTTVAIDADGLIDNAVIDTLEFDTVQGINPDIIHISGSVFAIAYEGTDGDGFVTTVTIDADGLIDNAVIDTLEFDTGTASKAKIIHVVNAVFAIAYEGTDGDGFVTTVTINADGSIDNAVIDTLEFDTVQGAAPSFLYVSGDVYAIAYCGVADDGFVITLGIETIPAGGVKYLPIMGVG